MSPRTVFGSWLIGGGAVALAVLALPSHTFARKASVSAARHRIAAEFGRTPLQFEENRGQTKSAVRFLARGKDATLFLTNREAVVALGGQDRRRPQRSFIRLGLSGGNPSAKIAGMAPTATRVNYLRGTDPSRWVHNARTFQRVRYTDVYPGVDLEYHGGQDALEYDFIVAPGAEPQQIGLTVSGTTGASLEPAGDLVLETPAGSLRQHRPIAYQETPQGRVEVPCRFELAAAESAVAEGSYEVRFALGDYDASRPLVIDPVLSYSTYLGGTDSEVGHDLALGPDGSAYVTGATVSNDFPFTDGVLDPSYNFGNDAFVAKLSPDGRELRYATYVGGGGDDYGMGIAVDGDGSAYITGPTNSADFPTSAGAIDRTPNGDFDAFVAKLDPDGATLVYGTYLGGAGNENTNEVFFVETGAIAVDPQGRALITGTTNSTGFPVRGGLQTTFGGGESDGFVAKLNSAGTALLYSSFLGGSGNENLFGASIATDETGRAYLTGETSSPNFRTTPSSFQPTAPGGADAFLTVINPAVDGAPSLVYSTYFGGDSTDLGADVAVDEDGNAYLTGGTGSTLNFPLKSAFQPLPGGGFDGFVAKFNPAVTGAAGLVYSSYVGGNGPNENGEAIAVDGTGAAYVTGGTDSTNFPVVDPVQEAFGGGAGDAFLVKVRPDGTGVLYATYLGGSGDEGIFSDAGVAADSAGSAYLTGFTRSTNFPTLSPLQGALRGPVDVYVTKICENGVPPTPPTNFRADGVTARRVLLQWTDTTTTELGFQVERRPGPANAVGRFQFVASLPPNATSYLDTGLTASTVLTYRVRVVNDCSSATSNTDEATTTAAGRLKVTTKKVQFGTVKVGNSKAKKVRVRNVGPGPVSVGAAVPEGVFAVTPKAGVIVAPGEFTDVEVTFSPTAPRASRATLGISDEDTPARVIRVQLIGKGKRAGSR